MATGGVFLYRHLEQMLPGILERRFRNLTFENGDIIPTFVDLEVGAMEVVRQMIDAIGNAEIIADGAVDFPVVDVSSTEDRYRVVQFGSAFSYTLQQMQAYEYALKKGNKIDVNAQKMQLVRRAIAEKHNYFAAYGDSRLNIQGFMNNSNVTLTSSTFDFYNAATSVDDFAGFFVDTMKSIYVGSNNIEMPTDCLIPAALRFLLIKKRMSNTQVTAFEYIKNALSDSNIQFNIRTCIECESAKLEAAGVQSVGTNKDRIIFYPKDPQVVERHIGLTSLVPEDWIVVKEGRKVYPMYSSTSPVIINYPKAVSYIDVPKAS